MKKGYVYILSNKKRTVLYIGVTSDIERRILEHKARIGSSFCRRYNITDLMFFEEFQGIELAIEREKQLKNWHRDWKWNLIQEENPALLDLAFDWFTSEEIEQMKGSALI